ncbi:MAG: efflux RND transporter periplasmic adaptor subunit [Thermodesulfovibrionia bacterium]
MKEGKDISNILGVGQSIKKRIIIYVVLLISLIGLVIIGVSLFNSDSKGQRTNYITEGVRKGDLIMTVTATGTLQPKNVVNVGTEVSGTIETIYVDFNSRVKKGDVLAKLDTSKLESQVSQARASLDSSRANLLKAEAELKRIGEILSQMKKAQELSGGRTPSHAEIINKEAEYKSAISSLELAKSQVEKDEANLRFYETELSKATIRSPISGIVLSRNIEAGQTVAASLQTPVLFVIAEDLKKMDLIIDVDEADIGKIREKQPATFTVDAYPERVFNAMVREVRFSPKTLQGVVTYETILDVENPDLALRPGMTATAEVKVEEIRDAVLIPNKALRFKPPETKKADNRQRRGLVGVLLPQRPRVTNQIAPKKEGEGMNKIWLLKGDGIVPVEVKTGATDGTWTEIKGGDVTVGDKVVIGVSKVNEG